MGHLGEDHGKKALGDSLTRRQEEELARQLEAHRVAPVRVPLSVWLMTPAGIATLVVSGLAVAGLLAWALIGMLSR